MSFLPYDNSCIYLLWKDLVAEPETKTLHYFRGLILGELIFGGLIFGGNFVLVTRGAYIRGDYTHDFML